MSNELHVIFGAGPAGCATAQALVEQGDRVRMVNRTGRRTPEMPDNAEVVAADVTDRASARAAATGAAVVYSCVNAPYHRWPELFPALQGGILGAAEDLRVRLVALENLYMYGEVDGPMTEGLPHRATTRKGSVRARMSEELRRAHEEGRVQVAIGRASDFYGPGVLDSALGSMSFGPIIAGRAASLIGNADLPHSYSFIQDVGRGLATLGRSRDGFGQVWHLPVAPAVSTRAMLAEACRQIGTPPRFRPIGRLMVLLGAIFNVNVREMLEMSYEFEKPFVVDDSKFRHRFGGRHTSVADGIQATLRWYRQRAGQVSG